MFADFLITKGKPSRNLPSRPAMSVEETESAFATELTLTADPKGRVLIGSLLMEPWKCWFLGEVYSYRGNAADPARLLEFVIADLNRDDFKPASLNGHFLLLARDSAAQEWHVWTNRFGSWHAYYVERPRHGALGSFFPAVAQAGSSKELDWPGLSGFFSCGFFPQDRTFFGDVKIMRPSSHYVFDRELNPVKQSRYWNWTHRPDPQRTYRETVAAFQAVFGDVMDDLLREGRIALPISGGLDSRTTVAAIERDDMTCDTRDRLWAYSYGYSDQSIETRISREIADCRRLRFDAFTVPPYLFERLPLTLASVEGFQDVTQSRQAAVSDEIASQADFVIAAHWGDVWFDDMGLAKARPDQVSLAALVDHTLQKIRKKGSSWLVAQLCQPHLKEGAVDDVLRGLIQAELERLSDLEDPDFRVKAFKTENWSFRWTTASLRMYQAAALPRLPFYDTRVAELFTTIPTAFVEGRRLQIDYIKAYAPDLARIKWQTFDTNLFRCHWFNSWLLPKRAVKKAARLLRARTEITRNWEVQFLAPDGPAHLRHHLLKPGLRLHDLVAPAKLKELLDGFFAAPQEGGRGYTLSMLLTFSSWLEKYG